MNFLNFDIRKILTLAFLVAIPVISVNMQKTSKNEPWIFRPFFFLSGITQNSFSSLTSGVRSTTDLYLNLVDIKTQNRELNQELAQLKARLSSLTELTLENERLNKLIDFKQKTKMNLIAARIVARDLFSDYDTITIDRGEKHGLKKGMAAITVNGAVGYTIQVEPYTSQILLLTDRYAVIDSIVQRSRARGIIQGSQKDTCSLNYLKRSEDVQVGDTVVTSGLDNIFPKGFPVGTVTKVEKDEYGLGQEVEVQPSIAAANLEELFVVIDAQQVDFEPEAGAESSVAAGVGATATVGTTAPDAAAKAVEKTEKKDTKKETEKKEEKKKE